MKTYSVEQIIEQVRIKYDEFGTDESEMIVSPDNVDMDTIIASNIGAAYHFVMMGADLSMLEGQNLKVDDDSLEIDKDLVGHIKLPDDFLRVVTVRLSSWKSSPANVITEGMPEYRMQSDPYACGTFQYPVMAIVNSVEGRFLELYKARTQEDTLKSFVYVPSCSSRNNEVNIPDMLSDAFIYYVAGLTATTFREDVANDFIKVAKGLIGIE